jgi:predicted RNA binding protein YcfA (HicA-like mRNA interferase family)
VRTLPDIAGNDLVACLSRHWDYHFIKQVGRHVRLETLNPRFQRVTIPLDTKIKGGLVATILKSIAAHKRVEVHNILDTL